MTASWQMLELTKNDLDCPTVLIQHRNDLSRHVKQIRHDPHKSIAIFSCRPFPRKTLRFVRFGFEHNQTCRMTRLAFGVVSYPL